MRRKLVASAVVALGGVTTVLVLSTGASTSTTTVNCSTGYTDVASVTSGPGAARRSPESTAFDYFTSLGVVDLRIDEVRMVPGTLPSVMEAVVNRGNTGASLTLVQGSNGTWVVTGENLCSDFLGRTAAR